MKKTLIFILSLTTLLIMLCISTNAVDIDYWTQYPPISATNSGSVVDYMLVQTVSLPFMGNTIYETRVPYVVAVDNSTGGANYYISFTPQMFDDIVTLVNMFPKATATQITDVILPLEAFDSVVDSSYAYINRKLVRTAIKLSAQTILEYRYTVDLKEQTIEEYEQSVADLRTTITSLNSQIEYYNDVIVPNAYLDGYNDASNDLETGKELVFSIFTAPIVFCERAFDFDLFGINFLNIIQVLLTFGLVTFVIKKVGV